MLQEIMDRRNIEKALLQVERNKGAGGVDGMQTDELRDYLNANYSSLSQEVISGNYNPRVVKKVEIPKPHGGVRTLGIPTVKDRLIQQAISQWLSQFYWASMYHCDIVKGPLKPSILQKSGAVEKNDQLRSEFTQWLQPFNEMGANTVTISNTGGTDHLAFDAAGIPGLQFIQDEIEYDTRTHHTTMDSYDHLQAQDLQQAAMVVAAFVYNTANRDLILPRKELPKPAASN